MRKVAGISNPTVRRLPKQGGRGRRQGSSRGRGPCDVRASSNNTLMKLLEPYQMGPLALPNHLVMAPLTRNRAPGAVPNATMARYYVQRASAGLIVTEGTQIEPVGQGYQDTPGIYS